MDAPLAGSVLPRLTALRGVAALMVFVFHLGRWQVVDVGPLIVGYVGVGFFFVLSGFVLAWVTGPGTRMAVFFRRRFARVYPLHALGLVVALLAPVTVYEPTVGSLVANVLLVQAWAPDVDVVFGLNGVSWSLSCEAAFFTVAPLLLLLGRRWSISRRLLVAGLWYVAMLAAAWWVLRLGGEVFQIASNPLIRSGEFVLGLVAGASARQGWRLTRTSAAVLVAVSVALTLGTRSIGLGYPVFTPALAPGFLAVIVLCAQADLAGRPGLLRSRTMVYFGEVSFAFYVVHELVLLNLRWAGLAGLPLAFVALMGLFTIQGVVAA